MGARHHPPSYIAPASEAVRLFEPPDIPSTSTARSNCPHLDSGLRNFHDASAWPSGRIPVAGEAVTIPAGLRMLLTRDAGAVFGRVTIPSSAQLIIGENSTNGVALSAAGIVVEGALKAGSATCRLLHPVTITLHGTRPSTRAALDALPSHSKGIFVTGTLELFGQRFHRTWTRLARPVQAGDTMVMLQRPVNWQAGQQIVLTTTAIKDSRDWHRNEVRTIGTNIATPPAGVGAALWLSTPAQYVHEANDGWQGEVALLSRTIVVQGAATDSEPSDTTPLACTDSEWVLSSRSVPCSNHLTGFGAHVMATGSNAVLRVAGVELRRVGQTNVLGRYPVHFHLMGDVSTSGGGLPRAYASDLSIHRSYYRCVSVHGTHRAMVTQSVAYDSIGHCFYLEDGIEEYNTFEYNLAAHIHFIGSPARGSGQTCPAVDQSDDLLLPADVSAAGYYITNANNNFVGNAASGGWAGFAFPALPAPIKNHRDQTHVTPHAKELLRFEGNSAHSSGWWWFNAGLIYVGGKLEHPTSDQSDPLYSKLRYRPCRTQPARDGRTVMHDTKVFLGAGVGLLHWGSQPELVGYEAHDVGIAASILGAGFITNMLVRCRTGAALQPPSGDASLSGMLGSGFQWYDTAQAHIITNATFRNCGLRGSTHAATDGCGDGASGCTYTSSVWSLLAHSDQHTPEFMQATRDVRYEACGKRIRMASFVADSGRDLQNGMASTVSGRIGSWLDADGSASEIPGGATPVIIGSGVAEAGEWWRLDPQCSYASEAPTWQCEVRGGRQIGSLNMGWLPSSEQENTFGVTTCGNGQVGLPCTPQAYVKHWGASHYSAAGASGGVALPVTLNGETTGALGGFGWHVRFAHGGPRELNIKRIQVPHDTKLLLSIAYPTSVNTVSVTARASPWCFPWESSNRRCTETFTRVGSIAQVRASLGNTYHLGNGALTLRIVQPPPGWTGRPSWTVPVNVAFTRDGISIPRFAWHPVLEIRATCTPSATQPRFCDGALPTSEEPVPCATGFTQTAFDQCCADDGSGCVDPEGQPSLPLRPLVGSPPSPPTQPPPSPPACPVAATANTCDVTAAQLNSEHCSCQYVWTDGCEDAPSGVAMHCE